MRFRILAATLAIALGIALIDSIRVAPVEATQPDPHSHQEQEDESSKPIEFKSQPSAPALRATLPTTSEQPASVGSISVELLEEDGSRTTQGQVMLVQHGHSVGPQKAIEAGVVVFSNLSPGQYYVRVDSRSLREGVFAPREQFRQERNRVDEIGVPVEVMAGEQNELVITLELGALVYGYLRDQAGVPLEWSHVRFGSRDPKGRRLHAQYADVLDDGFYQAYVYPGLYCVRMSLGVSIEVPSNPEALTSSTHPLSGSVRPLGEIRDLAGGTATQIDFQLVNGPAHLEGRLIDEAGGGFEGLNLCLYPESLTSPDTGETYRMGLLNCVASRVSDANGQFQVAGLMPGQYKLQIEPEGFYPLAAPGQSTVGKRMDPIPIRVQVGANSVEISVPRPSPVLVYGKVKVGPLRSVSPTGAVTPRATLILGPNEFRSKDRRSPVFLERGERFSFHLESREQAAFLELTLGDLTTVVPLAVPLPHSGFQESDQGTIPFP